MDFLECRQHYTPLDFTSLASWRALEFQSARFMKTHLHDVEDDQKYSPCR